MLKTLSMSEISRIFADANLTRLAKHYNIYMKKVLFPIFLMAVVLLLNGRSTAKKVAYFQNIDTLNLAPSVGL